jgi:uncharacterized protein involved in outer membrane biogenesis
MMQRRGRIALWGAGAVALAILLLVLLWDWNWFRPMVAARASAALGRTVTIGRLHVWPGRTTRVTLDNVVVANPPGFGDAPPFASVPELTVKFGLFDYLFHRRIVIPLIDIEHARVDARQLASGRANWTLNLAKGGGGPSPQIGDLRIVDGKAQVVAPKLRADLTMAVATQAPDQSANAANPDDQLIVSADGTYAGQKITGKFVGGSLLSLRATGHPYPVDLHLANGDTTISLVGTVQDPMAFKGAALKLKLAGKSMADLYPLTGIAIPATPPYHLSGDLDYAAHKIRFHDFQGVVGKSDLAGTIDVEPRLDGKRPLVKADLHSRSVDLNDLAGFIGGTPGDKSTPGQTSAQKKQVAQAASSDRLLPTTKINLPKLKAADVSLRYRGGHIQGRYMPFDNIVVALDITDGDIKLHPLDFAIGKGKIASTISLRDKDNLLYTRADINFDQLDLARIMKVTRAFGGTGVIGGGAVLDTHGNSLSAMLSNGDGSLRFNMASGGDLSALLQDLSGLEFGNAVLSALGIPNRAQIRCLRSQFTLHNGLLTTDVLALDTSADVTRGKGTVNFSTEKINYVIQTKPVHFSIGTLHAPIDIDGTLKHPAVSPAVGALAARGGAAVALGIVFPPLALLPTIQLGVGENTDCERLAKGR